MSIGSILWPSNTGSSIHLYLGFLVQVIEALNIQFPNAENNPMDLTKQYLDGKISEDQRKEATIAWWKYLDERESIRNFHDEDALMARLAICLLSVTEKDVSELGEHLSWFLEILGFLKADVKKAVGMMYTYFNMEKK